MGAARNWTVAGGFLGLEFGVEFSPVVLAITVGTLMSEDRISPNKD